MSKEIIMAGEGSVPTEQGAAAPPPAGEISPEDTNRLQRAETTLGIPLTEEQRKAILEAHQVGAGEPGKDKTPAGIENYTIHQLGEKIEKLKEAGFTKEQWKVLLREGITGIDALPDWLKDAAVPSSRFQTALEVSKDYALIDPTKLPPLDSTTGIDRQAEFKGLVEANKREIDLLIDSAIGTTLMTFLKSDIKRIYEEVTSPDPNLSARRSRRTTLVYAEPETQASPVFKNRQERLNYVNQALGIDPATGAFNYQETFWEYPDEVLRGIFGVSDVAALRREYKGVSSYFASRVAIAINKELKGEEPAPVEELGDAELLVLQSDLEEERTKAVEDAKTRARRLRRNLGPNDMLDYNDWREKFEFTWAENREELELSVFAWVEKFVAHLPDTTAQEVHEESNIWKKNAISALEKAAFMRLNISENEPFYKRLKSTIEAYISVLGGVKFLENEGGEAGFEAYTTYLEEFAHNFNEKHDAIYLGNRKSAVIQAYLARNHGEYALGASADTEKPDAGNLKDFRENIEEQAKIYAVTHELYIRDDDFKKAVEATPADVVRIRSEVALLDLSPERANEEINKRIQAINRRYGWDDEIEDLLLEDSRGTDPGKVATRTGVFKKIKDRVDREDKEGSLYGLSEDQRREVIRNRIKAKMRQAGNKRLADAIDSMNPATDQTDIDKKLWEWLRDYNETREKTGNDLWFPSAWDTVRLSIDRPTKLVDRALSGLELDTMIEEVGFYKGRVEGKGDFKIETDGLTPEEIRADIFALLGLTEVEKQELFEDALYDKQQRESEAARAFKINTSYQKFLGIEARWGGVVARDINDEGETEVTTISERAEEILKSKIDQDERDVEALVTKHEADLRAAGTLGENEIKEAIIWKRRLLRRDFTFGVTLALRELGIANDLPSWNYDIFNDPRIVGVIAPYLGYRHGDKPKIADLIDQGRREMRVVYDDLADEYMDGKILVVRDEANLEIDEHGQPKAHHEEAWDRKRVINEAGEITLREIFESRFMISTSGGVEVPDLISKLGDLGVYDLLWEMGCKDFREFQGFIKRRDEVELRQQSIWNTKKWKDPISYAKRLREAGAARVFLVGGNTKEGYVHGVLVEPLSGAYRYRDELFKGDVWADPGVAEKMKYWTADGSWRAKLQSYLEDDEIYNALKAQEQDRLVELGVGIMKPLLDYLDHRRYVMNRGGRSPTNWKLDNELMVKAYIEEMSNPDPKSVFGPYHLDYAAPGRSKLARKIFMVILRTSSYHLLSEKEYDDLGLDKIEVSKLGKHIINGKIKASRDKIEAKNRDLAALGIPADVQARIDKRIAKLYAKGALIDSLGDEQEKLENQYLRKQLHMQVVPEWPASLVPRLVE